MTTVNFTKLEKIQNLIRIFIFHSMFHPQMFRFLLALAAYCARCSWASDVKTDSKADRDVTTAKERLFFGQYSTLSQTIVSFTTSTVLLSCLNNSILTTTACLGRRRKKHIEINLRDK